VCAGVPFRLTLLPCGHPLLKSSHETTCFSVAPCWSAEIVVNDATDMLSNQFAREVTAMNDVGLALVSKEPEITATKDPSSTVRVVGLAGSPRRGGNTETLLDRFLDGAAACGAQCRRPRKMGAIRVNSS